MNATMFAPRNCFERSDSKSTTGAVERFSITTKTASATALSASRPTIAGEPQPHELLSTSANTSAVRLTVRPAIPGTSTVRPTVSSRDSCAANSVTITAPTATGRLMKKIARQETSSVSQPPSSGPTARAIADTPAHVPIALPRSSGGNALEMIDSVPGIMNAAPMSLDRARGDQPALAGGEADRRRRDREDDDAEQEHPAAAEDVAQPSTGDEQDGARERVGVDRPLERGERRAEVLLDRGQGDVHGGVVEHHHEEGEAHRSERPPAAVVLGQAQPFGHGEEILSAMGRSAACSSLRSGSESSEANSTSAASRAAPTRSSTSRPAGSRVTRRERRSLADSLRATWPRWTRPSTGRDIAAGDMASRSATFVTDSSPCSASRYSAFIWVKDSPSSARTRSMSGDAVRLTWAERTPSSSASCCRSEE